MNTTRGKNHDIRRGCKHVHTAGEKSLKTLDASASSFPSGPKPQSCDPRQVLFGPQIESATIRLGYTVTWATNVLQGLRDKVVRYITRQTMHKRAVVTTVYQADDIFKLMIAKWYVTHHAHGAIDMVYLYSLTGMFVFGIFGHHGGTRTSNAVKAYND